MEAVCNAKVRNNTTIAWKMRPPCRRPGLLAFLDILWYTFSRRFPDFSEKRQYFYKWGFILSKKNPVWLGKLLPGFTSARAGLIILGSAIVSFGLYNIHQQSGITEGGVLGTVLLLHHWLSWPASIITPILDISCYLLALKVLGLDFIKWSVASTLCVSGFFRLWESWPPMLPDLSGHPLLAAVLGAMFVGVGVGLIVRQGGSSGGDDALALSISKAVKCRISYAYLFTDLTVLTLSLTYIPFRRIAYSLITVTLSSWIIDFFQKGKEKS